MKAPSSEAYLKCLDEELARRRITITFMHLE